MAEKQTPISELSYESARDCAAGAIEIPDEGAFSGDFIYDEALHDLASVLIHHCDELAVCNNFKISFLWKKSGGKGGGKATLGKCVRASGLVRFFGKVDFVIWLAADNCLTWRNDFILKKVSLDLNLSGLMYHELCHIGEEGKEGQEQPAIVPHEFEGFSREIERFGIWRPDMKAICVAFQQCLFPSDELTTN